MSIIINQLKPPINQPQSLWSQSMEVQLMEFSREVSLFSKQLLNLNFVTVTADYSVIDKNLILADGTSTAITLSMRPSSLIKGIVYVVKKIDATGNVITIDPNGSETIDGAATATLTSQYDVIRFVSDGNNLFVI